MVLAAWICVVASGVGWNSEVRAQGPQLAEDVFLNVPDMGDVPVDEFMDTMGMIAAALSLNCTDCHTAESSSSWEAFAAETPIKRTARRMIRMVDGLNEQYFGGQPFVSCWTCHRGDLRPKVVPNLSVQYGIPTEDPNELLFIPDPFLSVTPDDVFDAYIEALGGSDALSRVTSFSATGAYNGFDTGFADVPVELYSTNSGQRTTIVHALAGDSVRVYDGSRAWIAATDRALPLLPLTGGNLEGARIEAIQGFPAGLRGMRDRWEVGYTTIDDQGVQAVQGTSTGETPVNLYFGEDGLLVRLLRFVDTPIGRVPTQIDFSDYREVSGIMMPFQWTSTWTNGQASVQLESIQTNTPIDPARFREPPPAEFR